MTSRNRLLLIFIFVAILTWSGSHLLVDDSLIYARYIRNALAGYGLVFNQGEHVNALTSPLYCYVLLGLAKLVGGNVLLASRIIFVASFLAVCFLAESLVRFAGMFVAAYGYFYIVQGMETSLFLLMLVLAVFLFQRKHWRFLPFVYVLLILTRFEGALLALIFLSLQTYRRKLPGISAWIPAAAIGSLYLLLNYHWYGHVLPSSTVAKLGQGMSGYWGRWPTAFLRLGGSTMKCWVLLPVLSCLILTWMRRGAREAPSARKPIGLFLAGLLAFYTFFNLPDYHWYYAPFIFFSIVYAAQLLPVTPGVDRMAILSSCLLCSTSVYTLRTPRLLHFMQPNDDYTRVDCWILQHAPDGTRIATPETGLIGWQLQRDYIIDTIGLTTPKNAGYIARRQPGRWLAEDQADYVIVHVPAWVYEQVVLTAPGYIPVPANFGTVRLYARKGAPVRTAPR